MEIEVKFKSITTQWFFKIFLVVAIAVVIVEIIACSFVRAVNINNLRSIATDFAQQFSVLSTVPKKDFYSTARKYIESFADKDKIEIEILDENGKALISTSGFMPETTNMPDYLSAQKSSNGTAYAETYTINGEPVLCGTIILADLGLGSNGAVRWLVSLEKLNSYCFGLYAIFVAVGLFVLLCASIPGLYFIQSIAKPIKEVSALAKKFASGNFEADLNIKSNNEIGELCDSINFMATELKSAESMKNDFISSVSHELRTPLTAIRGWGETAKMSVGTDEELVSKGLDVVLRESERLSALVEELLDFSRMQNGRLSLNMINFAVSDVLCEVVDIYHELASKQNIAVNFPVPKIDATVFGDRDRIKQVFINIIDNAVKYTESGGQVLIEQYEEDGVVRITVKDTGVGIPEQDIDRVKEKFFKSNKTVRGSGIGLAVADEIVKQHKGLLFVESTEGVGTTVTIALPVAPAPQEEPEQFIELPPETNEEENND